MAFFKASPQKITVIILSFLFCLSVSFHAFANETDNWALYNDKGLGFEIKHPRDWEALVEKAQTYRSTKLHWKKNICFASGIDGDKNPVCKVELYVTDDVDGFKKQNADTFFGINKIENSETFFSPPVKDGNLTKRVDVLEDDDHISNIFLEMDKHLYLFVMPKYIADRYDYRVFLTMIGSFDTFPPTEAFVEPSTASSAFQSFLDLEKEGLNGLHIKVSYIGSEEKQARSLALTTSDRFFEKNKFLELRNKVISYPNDEQGLDILTAQPEEMQNVLAEMNHYPTMVDEQFGALYLSVAVLDVAAKEGRGYFETILNQRQAEEFFVLLRKAFGENKRVLKVLQSFGCVLDLLPPVPAKDVTDAVGITKSGIRLNHLTGHFEQTLTLTNISKEILDGPISLLTQFEGNTRLSNADGISCMVSPVGRDFLDVPLPSGTPGQFFPGETLEVTLEFQTPQSPVTYSARIFSGNAER